MLGKEEEAMMIGIAQMLVWEHGKDNLPYYHQRVWLSEGWEYAPVELMDWCKGTEQHLHVTLPVFKWWLQPRSDIGV